MLNNSPHSAIIKANLIERGQYREDKATGRRSLKQALPNEHEVAILRRIARGHLLVTMVEGKEVYCYDDGTRINSGNRRAEPFSGRQLARFLQHQWIVPVQDESLIEGVPQRYIVPKR